MAPTVDPVLALIQEIEAGIDSLRTDSECHGRARSHEEDLFLEVQNFQANPPSQANATGGTPRRPRADRHKDDAPPDWIEPLNDTTGRTKRVYCTTPPPPINRQKSAPKFGGAAPSQDDVGGSAHVCGSARHNRYQDRQEPLNDTTGRPKRVFCESPPPSKIKDSPELGPLPGFSTNEGAGAGFHDFEDGGWLNKA
ncbi:hypothetical protein T484DRAFT_1972069 [Baffinella frigidus]|nr:hypothetical protein T484DRAFT_1972069 [Cryptophyta sp. CCMP2293]|eukprot:CAMPEP_0180132534 /NCGR_PEP_ID=MMETSP0986-20121125/9038_1 /TAXON_ID=697907 /ORGANISM="non described non described, Strain CCMP2293" /LENGTH=195 /DNA_ID=CAMNT_0022072551 /DNA_START=25 /DNA_END=612 /DNA_ORIENTATION=+